MVALQVEREGTREEESQCYHKSCYSGEKLSNNCHNSSFSRLVFIFLEIIIHKIFKNFNFSQTYLLFGTLFWSYESTVSHSSCALCSTLNAFVFSIKMFFRKWLFANFKNLSYYIYTMEWKENYFDIKLINNVMVK